MAHKNTQPDATAARMADIWKSAFEMCGGVGNRTKTRAEDLGTLAGVHRATAQRASILFRHLGMIEKESEYTSQNQNVYWTVKVPYEAGLTRIARFFSEGGKLGDVPSGRLISGREYHANSPMKKKEAPVVNPTVAKPDETVVIVGEDAPKPLESLREIRKDDAAALIEAARQHAGRGQAVETKIAELEALGLIVDGDAVRKAVSLQPDPLLDTVAQLVPEWDRLNRTVERLTEEARNWKAELTELRREVGQLREAYNKEKAANQRLSERNAQLAAMAAVKN